MTMTRNNSAETIILRVSPLTTSAPALSPTALPTIFRASPTTTYIQTYTSPRVRTPKKQRHRKKRSSSKPVGLPYLKENIHANADNDGNQRT